MYDKSAELEMIDEIRKENPYYDAIKARKQHELSRTALRRRAVQIRNSPMMRAEWRMGMTERYYAARKDEFAARKAEAEARKAEAAVSILNLNALIFGR